MTTDGAKRERSIVKFYGIVAPSMMSIVWPGAGSVLCLERGVGTLRDVLGPAVTRTNQLLPMMNPADGTQAACMNRRIVIRQLLECLVTLKRLKLVHMDIKPGNLLFVNQSHGTDVDAWDYFADRGSGRHRARDDVDMKVAAYFCSFRVVLIDFGLSINLAVDDGAGRLNRSYMRRAGTPPYCRSWMIGAADGAACRADLMDDFGIAMVIGDILRGMRLSTLMRVTSAGGRHTTRDIKHFPVLYGFQRDYLASARNGKPSQEATLSRLLLGQIGGAAKHQRIPEGFYQACCVAKREYLLRDGLVNPLVVWLSGLESGSVHVNETEVALKLFDALDLSCFGSNLIKL
jgi:hypothetical protein